MLNQKLYPLEDNKGYIELIQIMGSSLEVVNDARVSYERESKEWSKKDEKLLKFLIMPSDGPSHSSPLRGSALKFQVKMPIFCARQQWKHIIASSYSDGQQSWSEKSFRYTEIKDDSDYYLPKEFPTQDKKNHQGSDYEHLVIDQEACRKRYEYVMEFCYSEYQSLIANGVSKEIARAVLPPGFYTSFRWTVSLHAFLNYLDLREGHGAQSEIVKYAIAAKELAYPYFKEVFDAWDNRKLKYNRGLRLINLVEQGNKEELMKYLEENYGW